MAKLHVKNRFWITPNEVLTHKELSWKAKGIYGYIQSKPDGWTFSTERFEGKDGRDGTRAGVAELEEQGYLSRQKVRQEDGTWEVIYTLYETQEDNPMYNVQKQENHDGISVTDTDPTTTEKPTSEKPTSEIPATYKEISIKKEIEKNISFADFWKIYLKKENKILAEKRWNKLKDKEHEAIIEALQKTWNPYWTKKYQTPDGKLPTDYIKAPDGWLLNRKWEETPGTAASPAQIAYETNKAQQQAREKRAAAEKEEFDKQQSIHKRTAELAGRWFHTLPEEEQNEILEQVDKNNTVKLARNAIDRVHPWDEEREQKITIQKNIIKKITDGIILEKYKASIF